MVCLDVSLASFHAYEMKLNKEKLPEIVGRTLKNKNAAVEDKLLAEGVMIGYRAKIIQEASERAFITCSNSNLWRK